MRPRPTFSDDLCKTTPRIKTGRIRLIADTRERNVLRHEAVFAQTQLQVSQIAIGDYAIADDGDTKRLLAVIERKSFDDYAASIADGRTNNRHKLIKLREKTGCRIIYIIEGAAFPEPSDTFHRIPYRAIESSIFHLIVRDGVCVIRTKDTLDTAKTLVRFCESMETLLLQPEMTGGDEPADDTTDTTDAAADDATDPIDLTKMLTTPIKRTTDDVVRSIWARFPGISGESASEYMRKWSIADIICKKIPRATIAAHKSAVGRAIAKKTVDALCNVTTITQIKLLAGVPGVSAATSAELLRGRSLDVLLSTPVADLAAITVGKKKLGDKLANKIIDTFAYTT